MLVSQTELTGQQRKVVLFVMRFIRVNGYSPTQSEIAKHMGCSPNGANCHVRALVRRGVFEPVGNLSRALTFAFPKSGDNFRTLGSSEVARLSGTVRRVSA